MAVRPSLLAASSLLLMLLLTAQAAPAPKKAAPAPKKAVPSPKKAAPAPVNPDDGTPALPDWAVGVNVVGALLETDPAVEGEVVVADDNLTLLLSLRVLSCDETPPVDGAPVCLDSARRQKAAALATLLPRGVLSQFNVTTGGAKVRVQVSYQGAPVAPAIPLTADPTCSLYRSALSGNALFASTAADDVVPGDSCYIQFLPMAVQYRLDALEDPDSYGTMAAHTAASLVLGIQSPAVVTAKPCTGQGTSFATSCPLKGLMPLEVASGFLPLWAAYLNMLHAYIRDDLSISAAVSQPAPAAAGDSALTLKVTVLTCQESAALWAPNPEYPACVPADRKLKAKAWATFLPRGALASLNVTADGKGIQVQVWHNNAMVKPVIPLASAVPSRNNTCDLYRAAFKRTSLYHSGVELKDRQWATQDRCFLQFYPIMLQYATDLDEGRDSYATVPVERAAQALFGITSPFVATSRPCSGISYADGDGQIVGSPKTNCPPRVSLVQY